MKDFIKGVKKIGSKKSKKINPPKITPPEKQEEKKLDPDEERSKHRKSFMDILENPDTAIAYIKNIKDHTYDHLLLSWALNARADLKVIKYLIENNFGPCTAGHFCEAVKYCNLQVVEYLYNILKSKPSFNLTSLTDQSHRTVLFQTIEKILQPRQVVDFVPKDKYLELNKTENIKVAKFLISKGATLFADWQRPEQNVTIVEQYFQALKDETKKNDKKADPLPRSKDVKLTVYDLADSKLDVSSISKEDKYELFGLDETDSKEKIKSAKEYIYAQYSDNYLDARTKQKGDASANEVWRKLTIIEEELKKLIKDKKEEKEKKEKKSKEEEKLKKENNPPINSPDQSAAWILVSMAPFSLTEDKIIDTIKWNLEKFTNEEEYNRIAGSQARSTTLIWSGTEGNNTPVTFFVNRKVGYVLDPEQVYMPHAEFHARNTFGAVPKDEKPKHGFSISQGFGNIVNLTSKFIKKIGSLRDGRTYLTNYAKWDSTNPDKENAAPAEKGSPIIFARNVWKRYFKKAKDSKRELYGDSEKKDIRYGGKGEMSYNEALILQKGTINPIQGLIIDITGGNILQKEIDEALGLLDSYRHLKLYFYDRSQRNHIIRFCGNDKGREILRGGAKDINSKKYLQDQDVLPLTKDISKTVNNRKTIADQAKTFLEQNEKDLPDKFSEMSFADLRKTLLFFWGCEDAEEIGELTKYDIYKDLRQNFQNPPPKKDEKKQNDIPEDEQNRRRQIFNSLVRERIIGEMIKKYEKDEKEKKEEKKEKKKEKEEKKGKNEIEEEKIRKFVESYQAKFNEINIDSFLSEEEYGKAKVTMVENIRHNFKPNIKIDYKAITHDQMLSVVQQPILTEEERQLRKFRKDIIELNKLIRNSKTYPSILNSKKFQDFLNGIDPLKNKNFEKNLYIDENSGLEHSPLILAVENNNHELIKLLIDKGFDFYYQLKTPRVNGRVSIFFEACRTSTLETVKLLFNKNAFPNLNEIVDHQNHETILHKVIKYTKNEIDQKPQAKDKTIKDRLEMIEFLIKNGANPKLKNQQGEDCLFLLNQILTSKFTPKFLDAKEKKSKNEEAIKNAAMEEFIKIITAEKYSIEQELLLPQLLPYINLNHVFENGQTALTYVAQNSASINIMKLLVRNGANIEKAGKNGLTPLSAASSYGNIEAVNFLLQQGAYPAVIKKPEVIPKGVNENNYKIIENLIGEVKYQIKINNDFWEPISDIENILTDKQTTEIQKVDAIAKKLSKSVFIYDKDSEIQFARKYATSGLTYVIRQGRNLTPETQKNLLKLCLGKGFDPFVKTPDSTGTIISPMIDAAKYCPLEVFEYLFNQTSQNWNINDLEPMGETILDHIIRKQGSRSEIIKFLISKGAKSSKEIIPTTKNWQLINPEELKQKKAEEAKAREEKERLEKEKKAEEDRKKEQEEKRKAEEERLKKELEEKKKLAGSQNKPASSSSASSSSASSLSSSSASSSTSTITPQITQKIQKITDGQIEAWKANFKSPNDQDFKNITGENHKRGFDWWIFPSYSSTHKEEHLDHRNANDQAVYEALRQDPKFAEKYIDSIKKYIIACNQSKPPFGNYPIRYCKMVQSFVGITNHNTRLIPPLTREAQNELIKQIHYLKQYQTTLDTTYANDLIELDGYAEQKAKVITNPPTLTATKFASSSSSSSSTSSSVMSGSEFKIPPGKTFEQVLDLFMLYHRDFFIKKNQEHFDQVDKKKPYERAESIVIMCKKPGEVEETVRPIVEREKLTFAKSNSRNARKIFVIHNHGNHWDIVKLDYDASGAVEKYDYDGKTGAINLPNRTIDASGHGMACGAYSFMQIIMRHPDIMRYDPGDNKSKNIANAARTIIAQSPLVLQIKKEFLNRIFRKDRTNAEINKEYLQYFNNPHYQNILTTIINGRQFAQEFRELFASIAELHVKNKKDKKSQEAQNLLLSIVGGALVDNYSLSWAIQNSGIKYVDEHELPFTLPEDKDDLRIQIDRYANDPFTTEASPFDAILNRDIIKLYGTEKDINSSLLSNLSKNHQFKFEQRASEEKREQKEIDLALTQSKKVTSQVDLAIELNQEEERKAVLSRAEIAKTEEQMHQEAVKRSLEENKVSDPELERALELSIQEAKEAKDKQEARLEEEKKKQKEIEEKKRKEEEDKKKKEEEDKKRKEEEDKKRKEEEDKKRKEEEDKKKKEEDKKRKEEEKEKRKRENDEILAKAMEAQIKANEEAKRQANKSKERDFFTTPIKEGESHYQVLGITNNADEKDITKAYRRLALKYHPDKNPGKVKETEAIFKKISEAYEVLSKPDLKKEYDENKEPAKNHDLSEEELKEFTEFCGPIIEIINPSKKEMPFQPEGTKGRIIIGDIDDPSKNFNMGERELFNLVLSFMEYQLRPKQESKDGVETDNTRFDFASNSGTERYYVERNEDHFQLTLNNRGIRNFLLFTKEQEDLIAGILTQCKELFECATVLTTKFPQIRFFPIISSDPNTKKEILRISISANRSDKENLLKFLEEIKKIIGEENLVIRKLFENTTSELIIPSMNFGGIAFLKEQGFYQEMLAKDKQNQEINSLITEFYIAINKKDNNLLIKSIEALEQAGIDISKLPLPPSKFNEKTRINPLYYAVQCSSLDVVKTLCNKIKPDFNKLYKTGSSKETLLHKLIHNIDIDDIKDAKKNKEGEPYQPFEIAKFLIAQGASIHTVNNKGIKAIDVSKIDAVKKELTDYENAITQKSPVTKKEQEKNQAQTSEATPREVMEYWTRKSVDQMKGSAQISFKFSLHKIDPEDAHPLDEQLVLQGVNPDANHYSIFTIPKNKYSCSVIVDYKKHLIHYLDPKGEEIDNNSRNALKRLFRNYKIIPEKNLPQQKDDLICELIAHDYMVNFLKVKIASDNTEDVKDPKIDIDKKKIEYKDQLAEYKEYKQKKDVESAANLRDKNILKLKIKNFTDKTLNDKTLNPEIRKNLLAIWDNLDWETSDEDQKGVKADEETRHRKLTDLLAQMLDNKVAIYLRVLLEQKIITTDDLERNFDQIIAPLNSVLIEAGKTEKKAATPLNAVANKLLPEIKDAILYSFEDNSDYKSVEEAIKKLAEAEKCINDNEAKKYVEKPQPLNPSDPDQKKQFPDDSQFEVLSYSVKFKEKVKFSDDPQEDKKVTEADSRAACLEAIQQVKETLRNKIKSTNLDDEVTDLIKKQNDKAELLKEVAAKSVSVPKSDHKFDTSRQTLKKRADNLELYKSTFQQKDELINKVIKIIALNPEEIETMSISELDVIISFFGETSGPKLIADLIGPNQKGQLLLNIATTRNATELLEFLIKKGARLDAVDKNGSNILISAIESNNPEIIDFVLDKVIGHGSAKSIINHSNVNGNTPLFAAFRSERTALVQKLMALGADPLYKDKDDKSEETLSRVDVLRMAFTKEKTESKEAPQAAIDDLIKESLRKRSTPLLLSIQSGNLPMVKFLLQRGHNPGAVDGDGNNALLHVIGLIQSNGDTIKPANQEILNLVLNTIKTSPNKKSIIDHSNATGNTPLFATLYSNPEINKWLMENGADPDYRKDGDQSWQSLHRLEIMKIAFLPQDKGNKDVSLQHIESTLTQAKRSNSLPLLSSIRAQDFAMVRFLIDKKARLDVTERDNGYNILLCAIQSRDDAMFDLIFDEIIKLGKLDPDKAKAMINYSSSPHGRTALSEAYRLGKKDFVERLIAHGADPLYKDKDDQSPYSLRRVEVMKIACLPKGEESKDIAAEEVEKVIKKAAENNSTPLLESIKLGNLKMVKFLCAKGASLEVMDDNDDNVVSYIARSKDNDIIDFILNEVNKLDKEQTKLLINHTNKNGDSPLAMAVKPRCFGKKSTHRLELINKLLQNGADLFYHTNILDPDNPRGFDHGNILNHAVQSRNYEIIELILSKLTKQLTPAQVNTLINHMDPDTKERPLTYIIFRTSASSNIKRKIAKLLMDNGANPWFGNILARHEKNPDEDNLDAINLVIDYLKKIEEEKKNPRPAAIETKVETKESSTSPDTDNQRSQNDRKEGKEGKEEKEGKEINQTQNQVLTRKIPVIIGDTQYEADVIYVDNNNYIVSIGDNTFTINYDGDIGNITQISISKKSEQKNEKLFFEIAIGDQKGSKPPKKISQPEFDDEEDEDNEYDIIQEIFKQANKDKKKSSNTIAEDSKKSEEDKEAIANLERKAKEQKEIEEKKRKEAEEKAAAERKAKEAEEKEIKEREKKEYRKLGNALKKTDEKFDLILKRLEIKERQDEALKKALEEDRKILKAAAERKAKEEKEAKDKEAQRLAKEEEEKKQKEIEEQKRKEAEEIKEREKKEYRKLGNALNKTDEKFDLILKQLEIKERQDEALKKALEEKREIIKKEKERKAKEKKEREDKEAEEKKQKEIEEQKRKEAEEKATAEKKAKEEQERKEREEKAEAEKKAKEEKEAKDKEELEKKSKAAIPPKQTTSSPKPVKTLPLLEIEKKKAEDKKIQTAIIKLSLTGNKAEDPQLAKAYLKSIKFNKDNIDDTDKKGDGIGTMENAYIGAGIKYDIVNIPNAKFALKICDVHEMNLARFYPAKPPKIGEKQDHSKIKADVFLNHKLKNRHITQIHYQDDTKKWQVLDIDQTMKKHLAHKKSTAPNQEELWAAYQKTLLDIHKIFHDEGDIVIQTAEGPSYGCHKNFQTVFLGNKAFDPKAEGSLEKLKGFEDNLKAERGEKSEDKSR